MSAVDSKRILELALGKILHICERPPDESQADTAQRYVYLADYFILALSACESIGSQRLAGNLRHFEPLVRNRALSPSLHQSLKADLKLFISQINDLSAEELAGHGYKRRAK